MWGWLTTMLPHLEDLQSSKIEVAPGSFWYSCVVQVKQSGFLSSTPQTIIPTTSAKLLGNRLRRGFKLLPPASPRWSMTVRGSCPWPTRALRLGSYVAAMNKIADHEWLQMEVSWNGGTPKSSILIGFSLPSILGYPHLWTRPITITMTIYKNMS